MECDAGCRKAGAWDLQIEFLGLRISLVERISAIQLLLLAPPLQTAAPKFEVPTVISFELMLLEFSGHEK